MVGFSVLHPLIQWVTQDSGLLNKAGIPILQSLRGETDLNLVILLVQETG